MFGPGNGSSSLGAKSGPGFGAVTLLIDIWAGGTAEAARRAYHDRLAQMNSGGGQIAGITKPSGESDEEFLFRIFGYGTWRPMELVDLKRFIDTMVRILRFRQHGGAAVGELDPFKIEKAILDLRADLPPEEREKAEWLYGRWNVAKQGSNPTNLEFVQDDDLKKFKDKAELFEIIVSLGSGSAILLSKQRLGSFSLWVIQNFNNLTQSAARNELEKRNRSDLVR